MFPLASASTLKFFLLIIKIYEVLKQIAVKLEKRRDTDVVIVIHTI